ncbi:MAG: CCA tRNA nucleotidyltransferase [Lachnospiraceae bacterium]|nr:CCA tRNA nucleotidyltransferase [Lachnospiraceae bacterium]
MHIDLPKDVKIIIGTLENAGFEAYAVGGCVRDFILGRVPKDWDITTSAKPLEVKSLFRRTVDTGLKHGTITVLLGKEAYEVTTYRIDGTYEDSRHPSSVTFTPNLSEDLRRRDFTINAMAYNDREGLVDDFSGMEDIRLGIIRAVGNPEERFHEDALRILRAFRFAAQLGFRIEEETEKAARDLRETLGNISAERIRDEFTKLLLSPHPETLRSLYQCGISAVILPEFDRCMETDQKNPHHAYSVGEHTIRAIQNIREIDVAGESPENREAYGTIPSESEEDRKRFRYLRLAMLFHDMGKPACLTTDDEGIDHFYRHPDLSERMARTILKERLKEDNKTVDVVCSLVRYHDLKPKLDPGNIRKQISKIGKELFPLLFQVQRADILAQSDYQREEKLQYQDRFEEIYRQILEEGDCVSMQELAINGNDLIRDLNLKGGKEVGRILNELLDMVLGDPSLNERGFLLSKAQEMCGSADRKEEGS